MNIEALKVFAISAFKGFVYGFKDIAIRVFRQIEDTKKILMVREICEKIDSCYGLFGKYVYDRHCEGLTISRMDPKVLNYYATIRDLQNDKKSIERQLGDLEKDKKLEDFRFILESTYLRGGDLLELKILPNLSILTKKPIRALMFPPDSLIVAILRDDELLIPKGDSVLRQGDTVFVLGQSKAIEQLRAWIAENESP